MSCGGSGGVSVCQEGKQGSVKIVKSSVWSDRSVNAGILMSHLCEYSKISNFQ